MFFFFYIIVNSLNLYGNRGISKCVQWKFAQNCFSTEKRFIVAYGHKLNSSIYSNRLDFPSSTVAPAHKQYPWWCIRYPVPRSITEVNQLLLSQKLLQPQTLKWYKMAVLILSVCVVYVEERTVSVKYYSDVISLLVFWAFTFLW